MSLQTPTTIRAWQWKLISQGEETSRPEGVIAGHPHKAADHCGPCGEFRRQLHRSPDDPRRKGALPGPDPRTASKSTARVGSGQQKIRNTCRITEVEKWWHDPQSSEQKPGVDASPHNAEILRELISGASRRIGNYQCKSATMATDV